MGLLGHLGETRNDAQPPNPTRGRGAAGGQTPALLLARLSASSTRRKEVVHEPSTLTTRPFYFFLAVFLVRDLVLRANSIGLGSAESHSLHCGLAAGSADLSASRGSNPFTLRRVSSYSFTSSAYRFSSFASSGFLRVISSMFFW